MRLRKDISDILRRHGATAAAVVEAAPVEAPAWDAFRSWFASGNAATMGWLNNYPEIRRDPRGLIPGAKTMICCAFPFAPRERRDPSSGTIAAYAYGDDYHDALRRRLLDACSEIDALPGFACGEGSGGRRWRICIDSAPVLERYWAVRSGLATRCDNGMVEVEGCGSMVFLAEIVTVLDIGMLADGADAENLSDSGKSAEYARPGEPASPDKSEMSSKCGSQHGSCTSCGMCRRACPGGALRADGTLDASRCISYLSIEHRGEWDSEGAQVMATPAGRNTIYGCDRCLEVCPMNKALPPSQIEEFALRPSLREITKADIRNLTPAAFAALFRGSPIKRTKLAGLLRNTSARKE